MSFSPASLIAERTESGIASLSAHEKSTIKNDMARVTLRVRRRVSAAPAREYGTSLSARWKALDSVFDLSFSESSIMRTI